MNWKHLVVFGPVIVMLVIAGCSHRTPVTSANIIQQSRKIPHVGDRAVYSMKFNDSSGRYPQGSGSMIYTVVTAEKHGRSLPSYIIKNYEIKMDVTLRRLSSSKNYTVNVWHGIDAAGNVYLLGISIDGETWDIVSDDNPPIYIPANIKVGLSWKCALNCRNGKAASYEFVCVAKENIPTIMGNQDAYKLKLKSAYLGKGIQTGFVWVATNIPPEFKLKEEGESTNTDSSQRFAQTLLLESIELAK
ncbi:MAG: hypothetical protein ACYC0V_01415 [Armatimonadota bacterium]